ncbi:MULTISPECIES: SGNH/GDSL hydrolase family protein [Dysgonomonas]|uniref:SGNH/GDSL hydrolase family protein n=1 Tax=Dysgonomonas TaxID=156973 RepID=UPI00092B522A|nr:MULTISPECIES: SGNH/GDSL hydrolase family protein [Dysgonomonas]MBN9300745.1 SGNH/GDSL hydrolase family protein [Dysgonomonas mossii]OJX65419.1 MAG: capsular biosynthesis protein [Dysgonomonas sp. 37-18]
MKKVILIMSFFSFFGLFSQAQEFNKLINLDRYAEANAALPAPAKGEKRVVFIGNSITDGWPNAHPDFFKSNNYVGRGISGQTSPQLLSRFRQDVINLKPVAVLINIGTNDVAQNTGPYNEEFTLGNIMSMAELADANGIKVILSSVTPAGEYPWRKEIKDVPQKIMSLNAKIKAYAKEKGFSYIDYFSVMCDENNALKSYLGTDGVHPNEEGYKIMEATAKKVIDKVIK